MNTSSIRQFVSAALCVLSAALFTCAQDLSSPKQNSRPGSSQAVPVAAPTDAANYSYEFTQPKFYVKHIFLEHDSAGHGKITFERLNEDVSVEEPIQISPAALTRIRANWDALKFLDSQKDYQSSQQFPHLGTMKIGMRLGEKKRIAEFNWTHDSNAADLISEYRKLADQAILVFDISVARENQPLNAPKLMETMESYLKRNGLSDPRQLLPLLEDISTDEHVPLIARNHALRLIKQIKK
ncbi:MAG TPA: hypothetical protein VFD63_14680 [Pyrinomonadaceae bacterium]|nr:hypothetical protein [Pyrinomonadaceae bacterium]